MRNALAEFTTALQVNSGGRKRTTTSVQQHQDLESLVQNSLVEGRHFGKEKKVVRNEYNIDDNNNRKADDKSTRELSKYLKILYGLVDREIKRIDRRREMEIY